MSDSVLPETRPIGVLIAAGTASLLWLIYAATSSDPLLGQNPVHIAIEAAAVLATGMLFVLGGGTLAFAFLPGASHANALQRTLVYGVLALIAAFVVFSHYGWNLRAALTTSAIVTAAIGLAMQPTLSSVISGLVLNIDYRLRVGDGIISGGEAVEITSIGWRNVVARKSSGRLMVFPNARLADAEVEFVPAGRPVRGETQVKLPTPIPPDQVGSLVSCHADRRFAGTGSRSGRERHTERFRPKCGIHTVSRWLLGQRLPRPGVGREYDPAAIVVRLAASTPLCSVGPAGGECAWRSACLGEPRSNNRTPDKLPPRCHRGGGPFHGRARRVLAVRGRGEYCTANPTQRLVLPDFAW